MRIAIAGKGGAGKTTVAATLARLLARQGGPVLAIDADSNPNLAVALGVGGELPAASALPTTLVSRRLDGPALTESVDAVVDRYGLQGPEGVRVLLMGMPAHADEGCLCAAHATVSAVLGDLGARPEIATLVDMEASPEHLSRGTTRHVDVLLLVTEPYYRSLETIRRLANLARELPIPRMAVLANKVREAADAEAIAEFCDRHGLELLGTVPWSDAVVEADRVAIPLIEAPDGDEVVASLLRIAERLRTADQPNLA